MASLVEGANGGTQFSVNCYFSGQISVNYSIVLASSQLTTAIALKLADMMDNDIDSKRV